MSGSERMMSSPMRKSSTGISFLGWWLREAKVEVLRAHSVTILIQFHSTFIFIYF
ncbi:hypothetical protein LINPERPRIM_LOCUS2166 [Linum perenne]